MAVSNNRWSSSIDCGVVQRRIQSHVKHLWWRVLRKLLTAKSHFFRQTLHLRKYSKYLCTIIPWWKKTKKTHPAGIYLLKVNDWSTRTRCEICSKLTIKIPERRQWCRSGIFIVNFEHISHLVLVFLLLTLNMQLPAGQLLIRNIAQVILDI